MAISYIVSFPHCFYDVLCYLFDDEIYFSQDMATNLLASLNNDILVLVVAGLVLFQNSYTDFVQIGNNFEMIMSPIGQ